MSEDSTSLIDDWLDGSLSESGEAELEAWIGENDDHLIEFVEANVRDQLLREVVKSEFVANVVREKTASSQTRTKSRLLTPLVALAAIMVFSTFLLIQPESTTAEVVSSTAVTHEGRRFETGQSIDVRKISLESGSIKLALQSDVELELFAPLEAEFENDMRLQLFEGRINAEVGKRGQGFTVVTDAGEVIDLGTRFGVEAERGGESRVAVFSGEVEVHPRNAAKGDAPISLTEGQAARFSVLSGLRRWDQVALAAKAAGLASKQYAGNVKQVRDNRGDADGAVHPFYGIVRGGLQPGALAFTDKPNPRWAPRPGDSVPPSLLGADQIRTYHQFRLKTKYELTISLRNPSTIFVMINSEQSPPEWLAEGFIQTDLTIVAGPFQQGIADWPGATLDAEGLPYFEFSIWKTEAPAGDFTLGSSRTVKESKTLMYGLAVQPRSE